MDSTRPILDRHRSLVLMSCAMLFWPAYGLGHEIDMAPIPRWCSGNISRFCFALMDWTALMQRSPLQLLAWSVAVFVVISLPFFAGVMFVPSWDEAELIARLGASAPEGQAPLPAVAPVVQAPPAPAVLSQPTLS